MTEESCFAAIIENRAKEIGVAIFLKNEAKLLLTQFIETSRSYISLVDLLHVYEPTKVIVLDSGHDANNLSSAAITGKFDQVAMPRGAFDDTKAQVALEMYATAESQQFLGGLSGTSYLAAGASGAMFTYLEEVENITFVSQGVTLERISLDSFMSISSGTADSLELIKPLPGGSSREKKELTLFRWLNQTTTKPGARLLRANILQPLRDAATIAVRQEALEELMQKQGLAFDIAQCLAQLPMDLDKVCFNISLNLASKEAANVARRIGHLVQSVILLRDVLTVLPAFVKGLAEADSELLSAMCVNFQHTQFCSMLDSIDHVIDGETHAHKQAFVSRTQHCFAVKTGADGILDIARATFCRLTEEIHILIASYREQTDLDIKTRYTEKRGFYLVLKPGAVTREDKDSKILFPEGLINLHCKSGREVHCTSNELMALNSRLQSASNDCLVLTYQILEDLRSDLLTKVSMLHKLIDNFALLDMLSAFHGAIQSAGGQYVKPSITSNGPLAIQQGRHLLLDNTEGVEAQPNDTYMAENCSFNLLKSPNMSGKSTYLRQVALIVILAQMGCYVPAKAASLSCVDRIFTQFGTGDRIETNSSSFMLEMKETASILESATEKSLVLIDELGRATSSADGIALAWAVAEELIFSGAKTIFATHFAQMGQLAMLYPTCRLWHFQIILDGSLNFTWQMKPGNDSTDHYGLMLAPLVGIPQEVIEEAARVAEAIRLEEASTVRYRATARQQRLKEVYTLAHRAQNVALVWSQKPGETDVTDQLTTLVDLAKKLTAA